MKFAATTALMALILGMACHHDPEVAWSPKSQPSTAVQSNMGAVGGSRAANPMVRQSLASEAVGVLELAAESDHPLLRANALESLHARPEFLPPYARRGLGDENRAVRFVAAMTVGKFRLEELADLVEPLLHDESGSVRAAAIYALFRCGRTVDLNPLAALINSDDPEVRANAAMVLGLLGNSTGALLIEQAVGRGMELTSPARAKIVDLQLAEALFYLGRTEQVHTIRAALFLTPDNQEVTALACLIAGRMGDHGAIGGLQRLVLGSGVDRRPAEVRMAAITALAQLGEQVPAGSLDAYVVHRTPEIRHQAAYALGEVGRTNALPALARLLHDPNPLVQVAAAGAIAKLQSE